MTAFAQLERQAISTRTEDALEAAKRRGKILGKNGHVLAKQNKAQAKKFVQKIRSIVVEIKHAGFTTVEPLLKK